MSGEGWVKWGAVLAAVAVGLGAFGAHVLKGRLEPDALDAFELGARYQMTHAIGLILVGILALRWENRGLSMAGTLLMAGIFLFSGGLYVWSLSGIRGFVHVVPLGGISFLLGWIMLAVAVARR